MSSVLSLRVEELYVLPLVCTYVLQSYVPVKKEFDLCKNVIVGCKLIVDVLLGEEKKRTVLILLNVAEPVCSSWLFDKTNFPLNQKLVVRVR